MPRPIAIVTADTHLQAAVYSSRQEMRGDAYHGFRQCVDMAIGKKLPLIVAGDFIEALPANFPTSQTIKFLFDQLMRLRKADIPFYFINGQHDVTHIAKEVWPSAIGFGDSYVDGQVCEIGGKDFAFVSHRSKSDLSVMLDDMPTADVLICHQVWEEIKGGYGVEASLADFKYKTVISGDYHKRKHSKFMTCRSEEGNAYSPGATHKRRTVEPNEHGVVVIHSDLSVKFVKINSRVVLTAEVFSEADLLELLETCEDAVERSAVAAKKRNLPTMLRTPMFLIRDNVGVPGVESRLKNLLRGRAHVFVSLAVQEKYEAEHLVASEFISVEDVVNQAIESYDDDDPVLKSILSDIAVADDVKEYMATIKQRMIECGSLV